MCNKEGYGSLWSGGMVLYDRCLMDWEVNTPPKVQVGRADRLWLFVHWRDMRLLSPVLPSWVSGDTRVHFLQPATPIGFDAPKTYIGCARLLTLGTSRRETPLISIRTSQKPWTVLAWRYFSSRSLPPPCIMQTEVKQDQPQLLLVVLRESFFFTASHPNWMWSPKSIYWLCPPSYPGCLEKRILW